MVIAVAIVALSLSVDKADHVITGAPAAPRHYILRASSPAGGGRASSYSPILILLADTCAPPAPYGAGDTQAASHERNERERAGRGCRVAGLRQSGLV
jgi:hypothetical protein